MFLTTLIKYYAILVFILAISFGHAQDWQLVWSDEFDGNGAINSTNWFHQTQLPLGWGWYNGEVQHYTDRIDNSYVSNGTLKIVAKKETYTDQGHTKEYTSARLNSKYAFTYGKVEIRAKLPQGFGTWPAIWMLGKNINEPGAYWQTQGYGTTPWPACGEVDIMEHWGSNQNYIQSAIHTPSSYGGTVNLGGQYISTASSQFHIYTIDWSAQEMIFSVDGNVHYTYDPCIKNSDTWPFDSELYLLLNIAIEPSIASSFTESSMEIDYVRVYEAYSELAIVDKLIPLQYSINNIYPNPFNPTTTISFSIPKFEHTIIKAYDITGKKLETLTNEVLSIGNYSINWNASSYPSGVYLIRMESGVFTQTQKVVLVK